MNAFIKASSCPNRPPIAPVTVSDHGPRNEQVRFVSEKIGSRHRHHPAKRADGGAAQRAGQESPRQVAGP